MAQRIHTVGDSFWRQVRTNRPYPWHDWFNGSVWILDPDDYDGTLTAFRARCYYMAKEFGHRLRTSVKGGQLYIQALDNEGQPLPPPPPGS